MIDFEDMNELSGQKPATRGVDTKRVSMVNGGEQAMVACQKCGGSGQTRWGQCFQCQGKGKRSTRSVAASKAVKTRAQNEMVWNMSHEAELNYAGKRAGRGSTFYASLLERAPWTDRQLEMVRADMAKDAEFFAKKNAERDAAKQKVDISAIDALFATAKESGLKAPRFVAGKISLSLAPAHGKNPGAIYVKEAGNYAGKISGGVFSPSREASPMVAELVTELAADPKGTAVRYGRETGTCCCCGRELTDAESVAAGIGPVCAERWGF